MGGGQYNIRKCLPNKSTDIFININRYFEGSKCILLAALIISIHLFLRDSFPRVKSILFGNISTRNTFFNDSYSKNTKCSILKIKSPSFENRY